MPPEGERPEAGDERPRPSADRWLQITIPPEDVAEHSGYARLLIDYLEGKQPPASVTQPRVTQKLRNWADLTTSIARRYAAATPCARPNPAVAPVVALAQNPASSAETWITTADAAAMTGLTQQTIRNHAGRSEFRNERLGRTRIIHHGDFGRWWAERRGMHGAGSSEDGHPGNPGEPDRGGAARRGTAA